METMKRAFAGFAGICVFAGGVYFVTSKWAIRQETLNFFDAARSGPLPWILRCVATTK
jgi:hypothetical protein